MNKWFKLWFIPIILLGAFIGIMTVNVPPKFTTYTPNIPDDELVYDKDGKLYGRKMPDGMVYYLPDPDALLRAKNKVSYVIENPINMSVLSGAVIGWVVCKILDLGVIFIKGRIKKS